MTGIENPKKRVIRFLLLLPIVCLSTSVHSQSEIGFFTTRTISLPEDSIIVHVADLADSLAGDTIYQVRAENGYPVSYHRKIRTSVCFDNKCRLLNIIVHWNTTGRYLGFELPPGEFLSKAEHTPFAHSEYVRLHSLLADANSPLANISYNELVPARKEISVDVDAVSAPTSRNLLDFVVEGAAYTTYVLWHIIHGNSVAEINKLTVEELTPSLFLAVVESPDVADKVWALNNRHYLRVSTPEMQAAILFLTTSGQFTLAERAIHAIEAVDMQDPAFQLALLEKLDEANYSLKKSIIQKYSEARELHKPVRIALAKKLTAVSGDLVGGILQVFSEMKIEDEDVRPYLVRLLTNQNVFISRQAFEFLNEVSDKDKSLTLELDKYRRKHGL